MQIEVKLTLTLEIADSATTGNYIDAATGEASVDYLADLFDCDVDGFLYGDDHCIAINGKSATDIKAALAARIP